MISWYLPWYSVSIEFPLKVFSRFLIWLKGRRSRTFIGAIFWRCKLGDYQMQHKTIEVQICLILQCYNRNGTHICFNIGYNAVIAHKYGWKNTLISDHLCTCHSQRKKNTFNLKMLKFLVVKWLLWGKNKTTSLPSQQTIWN